MTYWQIASGEGRRDYADRFLKHGVAFVGERFASRVKQIEVNDVIVLKQGITKILAAGKVVERDGKHVGVSDKEWLRDFDGWDLPAYCNVQWHVPSEPEFVKGLAQGAIIRLNNSELQRIADGLLRLPQEESTQPEPSSVRKVDDKELLNSLKRAGLSSTATKDLEITFDRVRSLAQHYYDQWPYWGDVREHEARTFLIVPVLLALGWSEAQIKIELPAGRGRRADLACFRKPYRRDETGEPNNRDCDLIIETKDFKAGLDYVREQAIGYAENFPSSRAVVVSNGYCYKFFKRDGTGPGGFSKEPSAYFNLLRPRDRYPLDPGNVDGALELLKLMLPNRGER